MLKASYDWKSGIDEAAKQYILKQKQDMLDKEDDRLFIIVGETGAGKSMLAFHLLEIYEPNLSMEYIVQERKDFAGALKKVKDQYVRGERNLYLWFDEADTDNLEQQARWNKKLFSMYMKLRKLAIMHIWCFPSLKAMDRRFVEEKVRGVFFCYDKAKNRPRNYVFFNKKAILSMIDDDIRLNIPNLKKARKKYGYWMGYYKDYQGKLRKDYDAKKVNSMSDAVDEFADEFGRDGTPKGKRNALHDEHDNRKLGIFTPSTIAKETGIAESTIRARVRKLYLKGKLPPQVYDGGTIRLDEQQANMVKHAGKKGVEA